MYLKKRLKLFTCCSLAIAITTAMVGCGQQANAPGPSSSDPSPAVQTTPEAKTFKPEEPINVIVPFSPGGSSDLVARNVEKVWSKYCDQPIFIVNKAGGGGVDGATFVSRSKPDGYTLIMGYGSGHDTVMPQLEKLNYDPFTDLVPVSRLSIHSVLVLVKGDSEINSIKDVVDLAKKTNQPITAAVSTTAGSVDMVMRGIGVATGINITPVPHAGGYHDSYWRPYYYRGRPSDRGYFTA